MREYNFFNGHLITLKILGQNGDRKRIGSTTSTRLPKPSSPRERKQNKPDLKFRTLLLPPPLRGLRRYPFLLLVVILHPGFHQLALDRQIARFRQILPPR